jgi:hypothetical protein
MFKIGDKVIPIGKSVGDSISNSREWLRAKDMSQTYLYVNRIKLDGIIVCGITNGEHHGGDLFLERDLIKFEGDTNMNNKFPVGTKLLVIDAGNGAKGADNKTGVVTNKGHNSGLFKSEDGFNIEFDNGSVWRVSAKGKYQIIANLHAKETIIPKPVKQKAKVHIYKKLPYTFNAIVEDDKGNFVESQIISGNADEYKVIYDGDKTVVILKDGTVGISKRDPDDVYDIHIGAQLAFNRAKIKQIQKQIKDLEKGKRPAETRVTIVNASGVKNFT